MYASRVGLLPDVPNLDSYLASLPIYHFGNTKDPIFLGQCTGISSSCFWFDYAIESKCHIGKECVYDANNPAKYRKLSTPSRIVYHTVNYLYNRFFSEIDVQLGKYVDEIEEDDNVPDKFKIQTVRWHSIEYLINNFLEGSTSVPDCVLKTDCLKTEFPTWTFTD
jgi:hypothetical protein